MRSLGQPATILVYDSQYIKDMCTKPAHAPPPQKNRSVITLVRQLLNDAKDMGIKIHWIKVRGHSGDRGNDQADEAATMGLKGHRRGASDIARYLRERERMLHGDAVGPGGEVRLVLRREPRRGGTTKQLLLLAAVDVATGGHGEEDRLDASRRDSTDALDGHR